MSNIFDYLTWRGDILFSQVSPNCVDALIFSALSYINYDDIVSGEAAETITLRETADQMIDVPDIEGRYRVKKDMELLQVAAATERFGRVKMTCYQNIFNTEEETQFAAITFLLDDGTAFLTFRGTDRSLVGWKEDFNMTYQESVPAQRLARDYLRTFALNSRMALRVGGHSKGGNLAVYAAAKNDAEIRNRIIEIYNQDGPGFREAMMKDPGYLDIIPKIHTYVPESSVFGMLLKHKEPFTIIKSKYIGVMQHDPYNWEVLGNAFVLADELAPDSRLFDQTMDDWLVGMTNEERNEFSDTLFHLLMIGDTNQLKDIVRFQNIRAYLKTWHMDDDRRKIISTEMSKLVESAKRAYQKIK